MGFLSRLFKHKTKEYVEYEDTFESALDYMGNRIHNRDARKKYIEAQIEQMKTASDEIDMLNREYDSITAKLNDMDEIERLPDEMKEPLLEVCRKINALEEESNRFLQRESKMTDADYNKMSRLEDYMPKAYDDLFEAEEYQKKIKSDLYHIEGEKQAFYYRREELATILDNVKWIFITAVVAAVLCMGMLLALYLLLDWDVKLGLIIAVAAVAVTFTALSVKANDMQRESIRVEKSIVKLINLHNSVKIRYVNNTNLLDYLYTKYNVSQSKELKKLWDVYVVEKQEREKQMRAQEDLPLYKQDLVKLLSRVHISDPLVWLHQVDAILDHSEMVELRHNMILARQQVRGRIDENKRYGEMAHDDLRELMAKHPQYATEIMKMLEE